MERCAGCGVEADVHPIVGIGHERDTALNDYRIPEVRTSTRGFVAYGVCDACHRDPAHRRRTLKLSFFPRAQAADALQNAGSNSVTQ